MVPDVAQLIRDSDAALRVHLDHSQAGGTGEPFELGSLVADDYCEFVEMGRFGRPDEGAAISMVWRTSCLKSAASSRCTAQGG